MDPSRAGRIQELFHEVVDLTPAGRAASLDQQCGADGELRRVHVGQVAQRVHGGDVLQVVSIALLGESGGKTFLFCGNLERVEDQDRTRHDEVLDRR